MNIFDYLSVEGSRDYLILCYCVSRQDVVDVESSSKSLHADSVSDLFVLQDDWPSAVVLLESRVRRQSEILSTVLDLLEVATRSDDFVAALCMFDGAFGSYDDLFSASVAEQTYGFSIEENQPVLAFDDSARSSMAWRKLVAEFRTKIS